MKKTVSILAIAMLIAGGQLCAQSFQLGVKAGGNLSTFMTSSNAVYNSYTMQAGWNAGIFTNFFLGNHFAIAPELLYTTAGGTITTHNTDNNHHELVNHQL